MIVIHSVQRQEVRLDCPMNPLTRAPNIGPMNAEFTKARKAHTRSMGSQRSEIEPPVQVSGVEPKYRLGSGRSVEIRCLGKDLLPLCECQSLHWRRGRGELTDPGHVHE